MHVRTCRQFYLPENIVDLGCLTQLQLEVGGAVIITFVPATQEESDFIIIIEILSSKYLQNILWYILMETAIKYHSHPGFWRDVNGEIGTSKQFSYDGLHPNSQNGRKLYAKSLKALIHHGVRDVNLGRECHQYPAFY